MKLKENWQVWAFAAFWVILFIYIFGFMQPDPTDSTVPSTCSSASDC